MNLREEVENRIFELIDRDDKVDYYTNAADDILKLFEKRIDSINTTGMISNDLPSIDPRVYKRGFYDGIQYVKEMLK
jgi:hypothetical protein